MTENKNLNPQLSETAVIVSGGYLKNALQIIYEHIFIISDFETAKKCAVVTIRNIIKETLQEYTNDENHDRILHYTKVLEEVQNLKKVYFIKTPFLSENHFINKVGCLRYYYNDGRESSVVEPITMDVYLEEEFHQIICAFHCHDKKIVVVGNKM